MRRLAISLLCWISLLSTAACLAGEPAEGFPKQVTDLAGRQVTLSAPPTRLFLTQPRQLYALATLLDDPTPHLAGWAYPLAVFDPAMAQRFAFQWPALDRLPALSSAPTPQLDSEALLNLAPDLVLFDLSRAGSVEGSPLARLLDELGIAYLFIDFNRHPLENTPKSLALLGQALNATPRASAMIALIEQRLARIDQRLADLPTDPPTVLINVAPGVKVDCCRTNLRNGLADLVARAGGDNIADALTPGASATLSNEWVLSHPPDVILNTAGQWSAGDGISVGLGISEPEITQDLRSLSQGLPGWSHLNAVQEGQFYALWHGFHQGPFAIVALERIAQWLYPERFADLDPAATFDALLPTTPALSREGHFWGALNAQ
ncbi:ABC transporter substrate-binding protein [Halomonas sp. ISL-60]|uniref:ABC transporter substrate-binding protein n=1 Tax=Halomonas sp. ISL-56 TaxID=2819149 RepID=UPI001BE96B7F|nr:ABC transporter substrate-binding protein [Halomonas sp. ISL-56]MBT2773336.1 ABC transporter substrate-binding protein [Halomonas sp. ISL-60]MBT2801906.1 ABC transporter substrate-binding protein [Halomonas sp. ISL-56]